MLYPPANVIPPDSTMSNHNHNHNSDLLAPICDIDDIFDDDDEVYGDIPRMSHINVMKTGSSCSNNNNNNNNERSFPNIIPSLSSTNPQSSSSSSLQAMQLQRLLMSSNSQRQRSLSWSSMMDDPFSFETGTENGNGNEHENDLGFSPDAIFGDTSLTVTPMAITTPTSPSTTTTAPSTMMSFKHLKPCSMPKSRLVSDESCCTTADNNTDIGDASEPRPLLPGLSLTQSHHSSLMKSSLTTSQQQQQQGRQFINGRNHQGNDASNTQFMNFAFSEPSLMMTASAMATAAAEWKGRRQHVQSKKRSSSSLASSSSKEANSDSKKRRKVMAASSSPERSTDSSSTTTTTVTAAATTTANKFRDYQAEKWTKKFQELVEYKQANGHCQVPHGYKENITLGRWCKRQRYQYKLYMEQKPSTMTAQRIKDLENLGFVWDAHTTLWQDRFQELLDYIQEHGHANVPSIYPPNQKLAIWVKCQRRQFKLYIAGKPSNITEERVNVLTKHNFVWSIRRT